MNSKICIIKGLKFRISMLAEICQLVSCSLYIYKNGESKLRNGIYKVIVVIKILTGELPIIPKLHLQLPL